MEIAILALGCFWGPEIKFSKIDGVIRALQQHIRKFVQEKLIMLKLLSLNLMTK